ncbi:MAG: hypothetical protein IKW39_05050 [Alphaproteobacteria bacterium]|nr:hypothetical protein [Alphaproteobacteria bacterium]
MCKNLIGLIERNADNEIKAYFEAMGEGRPLDYHEELVLLEYSSMEVILSYINRFKFSPKAEIKMLDKVTPHVRMVYINFYGLSEEAQKYVIDKDLLPVAVDFLVMRQFDDVDYLLDKGNTQMISAHIRNYPLGDDDKVKKLLCHSNSTLFTTYVNKGYFISDDIKREILETENYSALRAVMFFFYRMYKAKSKRARDFNKLMEVVSPYGLSSDMQMMVLISFNKMLIELLLKTTPLCVKAQEYLFKRNFDPYWLKLHVETMYCVGGYRFEGENEKLLFKALAKRNLDDCLTSFRHYDDVSFVKFATTEAVKKYLKDFWLTDDAQVALIERGNTDLIKTFLLRFNPEHGICWQAEVALCKLNATEMIDFYIGFHTMCWDALEILKVANVELHNKYYRLHRY